LQGKTIWGKTIEAFFNNFAPNGFALDQFQLRLTGIQNHTQTKLFNSFALNGFAFFI
jgi:hypothetical protein